MTHSADLHVGVVGLGQRSYLGDLVNRPGSGSRVVALADPDEGARASHELPRFPEVVTVAESHQSLLGLRAWTR